MANVRSHAGATFAQSTIAAPAGLIGVNIKRLAEARQGTSPQVIAKTAGSEKRSAIHKLLLALVWLTIASSSVVFTEPAPVDYLTLLLFILLPAASLIRITPSLLAFASLWSIVAAAGLGATMGSLDPSASLTHSTISIYLYGTVILFATFAARQPLVHTKLILNAYLFAATLGAIAGLVGYFDLVPGAHQLLTKFGRASGAFKDPNVYGPFLIPALLYAIHLTVNQKTFRATLSFALSLFLGVAILLSFSRGAWLALAFSLAVWAYLSFVTAPTHRQRLKLIVLGLGGLLLAAGLVTATLQFDAIGELFSDRATLDHSYDYGPDGRFGGQEKARGLILDHPLGLGAAVFSKYLHPEDVHNVYLSAFLNGGWLSGLLYIIAIAFTVVFGLRRCFCRCATQPLFLLLFAAFLGQALEGLVIDTDHWRHFYLLMGLLWGLMAVSDKPQNRRNPLQIRKRRYVSHRPTTLLRRTVRCRRRPTLRRPPRALRRARKILPKAFPRRQSRLLSRRRAARQPIGLPEL